MVGTFQIAVFLQLAPFGLCKLSSILSVFLLSIVVSNCGILESHYLELFCLAKITEGTEVIINFKTSEQCCYFRTLQFGIYHAIWNTILGKALDPFIAYGLLAL